MSRVLRNWLVIVAFMVGLTLLEHQTQGTVMSLGRAGVLALGWVLVGLLAVGDGARRALGMRSFLGAGRGLGRLLAVIQVILGLLLLAGLVTAVL